MVETTTRKAQQLIKTPLSEGHIDKTTARWQCFTHLLKSTNRHLSEDLLYQGVPDLQNGSQHLLPKSAIHDSMDVTIQTKNKKREGITTVRLACEEFH